MPTRIMVRSLAHDRQDSLQGHAERASGQDACQGEVRPRLRLDHGAEDLARVEHLRDAAVEPGVVVVELEAHDVALSDAAQIDRSVAFTHPLYEAQRRANKRFVFVRHNKTAHAFIERGGGAATSPPPPSPACAAL